MGTAVLPGNCTGSGWDGVKFLYSRIPYGTVFWICD